MEHEKVAMVVVDNVRYVYIEIEQQMVRDNSTSSELNDVIAKTEISVVAQIVTVAEVIVVIILVKEEIVT